MAVAVDVLFADPDQGNTIMCHLCDRLETKQRVVEAELEGQEEAPASGFVDAQGDDERDHHAGDSALAEERAQTPLERGRA